jgi:hypothetical protein
MYLVQVDRWRRVPTLTHRPVTSQLLCARCHTLETGDRETEEERQSDRETESVKSCCVPVGTRYTDSETERRRDREAERQRGRATERQRGRESHKLLCARCHTLYPIVFVENKKIKKRKRGGNDKNAVGRQRGRRGGAGVEGGKEEGGGEEEGEEEGGEEEEGEEEGGRTCHNDGYMYERPLYQRRH